MTYNEFLKTIKRKEKDHVLALFNERGSREPNKCKKVSKESQGKLIVI